MKKNEKGFFLAETIVVLALVTAVMAFVYPNTSKLYETFKNKTFYYDQTQDIYTLKAIYDGNKNTINSKTISDCNGNREVGAATPNDLIELSTEITELGELSKLYITSYTSNPIKIGEYKIEENDYNFNKYLKRMRKTTYDSASYRLIGVFKKYDDNDNTKLIETRYATIKIENPNPDRHCNLGGN